MYVVFGKNKQQKFKKSGKLFLLGKWKKMSSV